MAQPQPYPVLNLSPDGYVPHALHSQQRDWPETNCYADLWIEILANAGLDPNACLGFTLGGRFEADQWTFLKPQLLDLENLYGLRIEELNIWDDFAAHVREQLAQRRLVLTETDAFYLPDTKELSYHEQHVKTSIAIERLEPAAQRMRYFHNAGYFELEAEDYPGVLEPARHGMPLPPYVELVDLSAMRSLDQKTLGQRSLVVARRVLTRLPSATNPIADLLSHLHRAVDARPDSMDYFHRYAFASVRQCGAGFELAADYLKWLSAHVESSFAEPERDFRAISAACKTTLFKLARAVQSGRPLQAQPLEQCVERWERAMQSLRAQLI